MGEHYVIKKYDENPDYPNLYLAPTGQQNVDAISYKGGERYNIKTITSTTTRVIRLEGTRDNPSRKPIFEYLVICKLSESCRLEGIYQIDWDTFFEMKKWHKTMNAWNVSLTKELRLRSKIIYESNELSKNEINLYKLN